MKSRLIFGAALCSTVVLSAMAVHAQQADQPASPDAAASDALSSSGADWAGYAHVGYRLDPHWRMDLQGGYHAGAPGPASASGDSASFCAAATGGAEDCPSATVRRIKPSARRFICFRPPAEQ